LYRLRVHWLEIASGDDRPHTGAIEFDRALSTPAASVSLVTDPSVRHLEPARPAHVRHAFSVDVEDWFHGIPVDQGLKSAQVPRLERGLHVLLDLLAERGARGTFFILGPLVDQYPQVIRRIAAEGHELGCHGWSHDLVYQMSRERFVDETTRARDAIQDLTGMPVRAYRAAYFSITQESLWALEVLARLGFKYDSSIFPVRNWRYGIANFTRDPVLIETPAGSIWEFPISVMNRYGQTIPVSGGAYFRLYPYGLTRANFRQQERAGRSVIFYLHPWELDPDHPQVPFAWRPRLTHYANLQSTRRKLVRLLREFDFGAISDVVAAKV
jgi:polysaccharide deacetylase family protein (PEP-CTERM system associated)